MARMLTMVCAAGLLALLIGAAGCHKRGRTPLPATGGVSGQPARDELTAGLQSEHEEMRQFACIFITRFKLPGYEQPLRKLAAREPVPAMALAVVYRDARPLLDWYAAQPDRQQAVGAVLGAATGLECTRDVPPELWAGLIGNTPPEELPQLAWSLAQASCEPGGPAKLDRATTALLESELAQSKDMALAHRAAYDALLGGEPEHRIDWQRYDALAEQVQLSAMQWRALLRWADADTWRRVLKQELNATQAAALGEAAALAAPAGVELGWNESKCRAIGLEVPRLVLQAGGKVTPELQRYLDLMQAGARPDPALPPAPAPAQLMHYLALRGNSAAIEYALGLAPEMEPHTLAGVVATLARDNPDMVTDEQLSALVELAQPNVAYWLLLAWPGRQAVVDSRMPALVRVTPGQENVMLVYAYRLSQAQAQVSEDG